MNRNIGRPRGTVHGRTVPDRALEAATSLFARQGYEGTSLQQVADTIGVTKGALYHYFPSKEELLYEIYGGVLRRQIENLTRFAESEAPISDRLRAAARDVISSTFDNLEGMTIFFRSLHQLSDDRQKAVRQERRRYHEVFRGMIEEGQRTGTFRDDVPAEIAADAFFGSVHHLPTWYQPQGRHSADEITDAFAELLLRSLSPR
ncbi:MAG TPA: TetR/AcrR family transcriptional regulator [Candidatus Corynebacterium avicola]|uniref:TetR/AcrR family transcriptional regulator n=1 Tax=Candidatus Corynebacterium avicola TaxID=2838527 RepID=A0A9D1UN22_9CORY|nr:TetR/AcrR family transcriptional regulator [Candidatus Corynebacterium avicola]